jgi:8-oxo-dGTP pyrophosphatase MutT (NUDIX family)
MPWINRKTSFRQKLGRLIHRIRRLKRRHASTADQIPRPAEGKPGRHVDRVAAVCYRRVGQSVEFMLVRTTGGNHWTFPKGHVEAGEAPWAAAQREALEEAGVRGGIESTPLTLYPHEKHTSGGRAVELTVAAYLLHVESEADTPEPGRDPTWFPPEQAKQKLAENRRPQYQQAFSRVIDEACKRLKYQG